jgi:surface antigen
MSSSHASTAALKQQVFLKHKQGRKAKGMPKPTTIASYMGVFLLIITLVAIGYQPPQKAASVASTVETSTVSKDDQPSVDQVVATTVAGDIAERANLAIAPNVAELSVSLSVKSELAQTDDTSISKPQIVQPTAGSREIKTYIAKAGDTVPAVAAQYGVSVATIKWANNLTSDVLNVGKELVIPPTDGVIYTAKAGDTVASLAQKYGVSAERIVSFNDLEIDGLATGRKIILPGANLPETERPGYVAPRSSYSSGSTGISNNLSASAGNKYAPGYCTWYVYERRAAAGRPIGSYWGNASSWAMNGRAAGFVVDNIPAPGAIMQNGGGAGHVAYVESVAADGTITFSDMNGIAGFGRIGTRTMTAGQAALYTYIH